VSKTERKSIQERFELRRPVSIIPNGISLKQIENAQPYAVDRKLILSVGRLERYKNNHRLVEAMRYLSSDEFSLCIIGSGKFRGELEQQIRRQGLSDSVKILGSRSDDEVYRWMKTCSVFVNLSNVEAFGITVLEALAAHSRVIVNDKFGLRELSRKFTKAIIPVDVKTMHPRDLAQVIRETAETRANGVNLSEFDWNPISKRIKETYLEVATETDAR
jgi:glycosyltransferase involved in cell wall biosynthesis